MNSNLPSSQVALALLFDCGCSERVIAHCKAVSALAVKFASVCQSRGYPVDVDLVEVGALLHDIGRSKTHDVSHAVVGVEIAKSLNLPEPIVSIIEHHIGGGISADEAKELGLVDELGSKDEVINYVEEQIGEKVDIVSYKKEKGLLGSLGQVMNEKFFFVGKGIGNSFFTKAKLADSVSIWT